MTNIEQLMQDSEVMRMLKLGNPERSKDFNAPELAVGLFDIERQLKDPLEAAIYNSPDPNGTIASFDTALMLNNLGIDMPSAHKMAKMGFSSSATGIDTRDKNYWEALKTTAQHSHWQDMKGITTSLYRITGNRDFLELANGYDGKVRTSPVSNTYGEMGDLVLDSVQPAMSSLKFMATTALLSWIPGGVANKVWGPAVAKTIAQGGGLTANAVNWFSTGYSQAGDVLYNVMRMEDAEGHTLPWDSPVGGALFHGLAGLMGLVELGSMEMFPWYKQLKIRFTDRELLKHIERGFLAATKSFLWKGAAGTISEGGEEGIQTGLGIGFENALKALANKDGAKFDLTSFGDTIKEAAKATYDAGKSMFLTSFLTAGLGQGAYSMRLRASAKKNFLPSKDSIPIDSLFVGVPKDTIEQMEDGVSTGPIEPIHVVNVGTHLAPVDQVELAKAARAKKNGAEAMEIVVEDMPSVESSDRISMLHRAAVATEARIVDDARLGFESEEALDRAAFLLASNTESIRRTGGGIDITLRGEDGKLSKLSLGLIGEGQEATDPDISYIDDPKAPYSLSAMTTDRALEWQERQLIKESLGDIVSHTGGRISTADLEANVDAVKLVAETLNIPTDQMLRENLVFKLEKASPKGERGYIENVSIEGKRRYTIHVSEKADATTILHEIGHFMRGTASKEQLAGFTSYYGKGHDAVWLEDLDKVGDQYVVNGKHFDTFDEAKRLVEANEEAFADDFVAYLRTGQAPTEGLRNIFRRMKAVLQRFVREFGYQLDPAVKQAFDMLLGGGPQGIKGSFGTIPSDADGNTLFQGVESGQRLKELREAEPIELLGTEIFSEEEILRAQADIDKHDTPLWKELKKKALEYGKRLRGSYPSHDGEVIVNRDSIKELLIHDFKNIEHLQSIAAIPSLISNSIHVGSRPNHNSHSLIKEFDYHVAGLRIGGTDYTVKSVISKTVTGKRYYDHKLTVIEKGELMDLVSALSSTALQDINSPISTMDDKRLVSVLQDANSKSLFQMAPPAGSPEYEKLVENAHAALRNPDGTLKVFYHGSDVRLEDYDPSKLGFMTGSPTAEGGFFFTEDAEVAQEYAELAVEARPLREDQYRLEAEMEVFTEREAKLDSRRRNDEISEDDFWELLDELFEEREVVRLAIDKIMVALATGDLYDWDPYTEPIVNKVIVSVPHVLEVEGDVSISDTIEQARKDGYDAVYFKDIEDSPYGTVANNLAVFNPEHIHSIPDSQDDSGNPNGSEESHQSTLYQLDVARLPEASPWRLFQLEKVESVVTVRDNTPKAIRVYEVSMQPEEMHRMFGEDKPAKLELEDLDIAWATNANPTRVADWQKIYARAMESKGKNGKDLKFSDMRKVNKDGKLMDVPVIALSKGCQRAQVSVERVSNGVLPNETNVEACYGGTCWVNRQFNSKFGAFENMEVRDLLMPTPDNIDNWFKKPSIKEFLTTGPFIREGQMGCSSHAFPILEGYGVSLAETWLKNIRNLGINQKTIFITAAYAPVTKESYERLLPYKDLFEIHVSISGWFHKNELMTRLAEFKAIRDVGLPVSFRIVTNKDNVANLVMSNQEWLDSQLAKLGIHQDEVLETPYHDDAIKKGQKRSEPTGDYKFICCETGKCVTCGAECMSQVTHQSSEMTSYERLDKDEGSPAVSTGLVPLGTSTIPQIQPSGNSHLNPGDLKNQLLIERSGELFQKAPPEGTQAFKDWFGDSKIVDIQGNPLKVFHGSASQFTEFSHRYGSLNTNAEDSRNAFFFTPSFDEANMYAGAALPPEAMILKEELSDVYRKLAEQDIFFLKRLEDPDYESPLLDRLDEIEEALNNYEDMIQRGATSWEPSVMGVFLRIDNPRYVVYDGNRDLAEHLREARANGHDGAVFRDPSGRDPDYIVVFDDEQIGVAEYLESSDWYKESNAFDYSLAFPDGENHTLYQLSEEAKKQLLDSRKRDVMEAVRNFYWIPEQVVQEYAGEEWADTEIRFRNHLNDYPWILEEARKFSDTDEFLEHLQTSTDMGEYRWVLEDELWFKRVHAYSRIMDPKDKDSQFVRFHTGTDKALIELGRRLRGYEDVELKRNSNRRDYKGDHVVFRWGAFKGVSPLVKRLDANSSSEEIQQARKLVQDNPRPYRKAIQVIEQAQDRVLEMRGLMPNSEATRDAYYDTLGEEMSDALDEPLLLNQMSDREAAEYLRTSKDKRERYNAREKLATHDGVIAMEQQANAELKRLGAEKDQDIDRTKKQLSKAQSELKTVSDELRSEKNALRSTQSALDKERARAWELVEKLDAKSRQASMVGQLERDLAGRRERVNELRRQLSIKNEQVKKLRNTVDTLEAKLKGKRLLEALEGMHKKILATVTFNPDSVDASFEEVFNAIHRLFEQDRRPGNWELIPEQMGQYIKDAPLHWIQQGRKIIQWTLGELETLYEAARLMRMDAKVMLEQKKLHRMDRLQNIASQFYRQTYGELPEVGPNYGSLMNDIIDDLTQKRDTYDENIFNAMFNTVRSSIGKMQRISRMIDGNKEGVAYQLLVRDAYERMTEELRESYRRLQDADKKMKELEITSDYLAKESFTYTTPSGQERTLSKGEVIGLHVYSQNPMGAQKLIHNRGNNIPFDQLAEAIGSLGPQDKAWGDYMIDSLGGDEVWERMQKIYYEVYNRNLGRRKRYFTFVAEGKVDEGKTDLLVGPQGSKLRYVDKDFTKVVNPHAIYPLKLNVTHTFTSQVKKQEHFIQWADWTRDMNYLLAKGAVGRIIDMNHGPKFLNAVQEYVNDVGSPQSILDDIDRIGSKIISNAAVAALSLNFLTMLKQLPSFSSALRGDIGAVELANVALRLTNPKTHGEAVKFIHEMSPYMLKRSISVEVEKYNASDFDSFVGRKIQAFNENIGMKGIQMMDQVAVNTLWLAAYDTYVRRNPNSLREEALKKEAAFRATQLISETQPTSIVNDLSSLQRKKSPWVRAALLFSNQIFQYINMVWYDLPTSARAYIATKNPNELRKMFGVVMNMAISGGLIMLVSGVAFKGDDDDEEYWDRIKREMLKMTASYTLPIVGNAVSQGVSGFYGGELVDLPSAFGRMMGTAVTDWEKMNTRLWDLLDGIGSVGGLPTAFINRAVKSVKEENPLELFGSAYGDLWEAR